MRALASRRYSTKYPFQKLCRVQPFYSPRLLPTPFRERTNVEEPERKHSHPTTYTSLNDGKLGSGDVESIDVRGEADESLLATVWPRFRTPSAPLHSRYFFQPQFHLFHSISIPREFRNAPDQGVDLDGIDIVELLDRILDLPLVRLDVDNEDEGVVLLNLLHRGLGVERVDDDLVLIKAGSMGNALARVTRGAGKLEGLRAVEGDRVADLGLDLGVGALQGSLLRVGGLLSGRLRAWKLTQLSSAKVPPRIFFL